MSSAAALVAVSEVMNDSQADLAALGPFFALAVHPAGAAPARPWRPLDELVGPGPALPDRIRAVRVALAAAGGREPGQIEERVAVSVAHLGLVARLIAPAVGAAALGRPLGVLAAGRIWWQDQLGRPYAVSLAPDGPRAAGTPPAGSPGLAGTAVEQLTLACHRRFSVSPRVLWGNVASAANSAAGLIGHGRPDLAAAARAAAGAILRDVRVDGGDRIAGPGFRRRSCCLIYRLAGSTAAVCGDCVLQPAAAVRVARDV